MMSVSPETSLLSGPHLSCPEYFGLRFLDAMATDGDEPRDIGTVT